MEVNHRRQHWCWLCWIVVVLVVLDSGGVGWYQDGGGGQ